MTDDQRGLADHEILTIGKISVSAPRVELFVNWIGCGLGLEWSKSRLKDQAREIREAVVEQGIPSHANVTSFHIVQWTEDVVNLAERRNELLHSAVVGYWDGSRETQQFMAGKTGKRRPFTAERNNKLLKDYHAMENTCFDLMIDLKLAVSP